MPNFTKDYDDIDHLVDLLDDEDMADEPGTLTSMPKIEEFGSLSQTGKDAVASKILPGQLLNNEINKTRDLSKLDNVNNGKSSHAIDPLEVELAQMEERMKKLKAELCKKKNITKSCESEISFTKFSEVVVNQRETIRNLTDLESKEVLLSLNGSKSVIHSGETDSEDDEDNRNPYDQNLSSSGREMKKRIAYANDKDILNKRSESLNKSQSDITKLKYGFSNANTNGINGSKKAPDSIGKQNDTVDPFSGIKLCNPLISSAGMKELMVGRKMILMSSFAFHLRSSDIVGDWVTIGIIVSKSDPKKSQKGSQYLIWQLSDLRDCTKVVSLFIFTDAFKHLWKTTVGTAIGILNPQIMKERENEQQRSSATLSVNNHQNILIMGTSKDLGWCKGRTKIGPCRQFVNKSVCEFCVYHVQREYQKSSSKRADLQSSFTNVDPRKSLQKKVLGKDQVFYGGSLFSCGPVEKKGKHTSKLATSSKSTKDLNTLCSLNLKLKAKEAQEEDNKQIFIKKPVHLTNCQVASVKEIAKVNGDFGQMLLAPTPGALNLLKHISKEPGEIKSSKTKSQELSAKELLAETKKELRLLKQKTPMNESTSSKTPHLGRGFGPGKDFEFEVSPISLSTVAAKNKAANILKQNGGLKVKERNMKRNKEKALSAEFQENIKKKIKISIESEDCDQDSSSNVHTGKVDPLFNPLEKKSLLGSLNINSSKFQSMIRAKSSHTNLIQATEDEQVEKYYNSLEKKEMIENKMISIMEIPTTAVVCLKCKYKAVSASVHCREESHPLKSIKAVKRFFECQNCKRRTSSLDKFPRKSCSNCDQSSWKRVGMGKEKQGPKLENEILSLRGDELSHYSGASNQIYLHL